MRKTGVAEWLLVRAAGAERGTAIYGDLVELAAARGRVWFWMAYARTLIALTWRTQLGFLAGFMSFNLLLLLLGLCDYLAHDPGPAGFDVWIAFMWMGPFLGAITTALLLFVPYAVIRYGLRDRMTCLACALLLLDAVAFVSGVPSSLACIVLAAIPLSALSMRTWRRPAAVLMATIAVSAATAACFPGSVSWTPVAIVTLPITILVCSSLRGWLLERASTYGGNTLEAAASH